MRELAQAMSLSPRLGGLPLGASVGDEATIGHVSA